MTTAGLLLAAALCGPALGQEASTATVASSTAAVAASTPVVVSPPAAPEEPVVPRSRVVVHREAADWEPVSVRLRPAAGGRSSFEANVRKVGGRYRGRSSAVKAAARVYPAGEDLWLVVCVYPAALRPRRMHLEARFFIQEGYLEKVEISAVRVVGGAWSPADEKEDTFTLRSQGVDFNEQMPGSAEIALTAINPGPGPRAPNAGGVRHAAFGGEDLGFVNFSWSVTGVAGEKAASSGKKPAPRR
ncbi:MAG: hypothetical protein NTY77_02935 [Elusimicrobia bacterium]|nr:hypothetical protein [Elusimicrobiota bacterium]